MKFNGIVYKMVIMRFGIPSENRGRRDVKFEGVM